MKFSIEELYRCTRVEYCRLTGVTPGDLIAHLEAEVKMLERSLELYRNEYRYGESMVTDEQKTRAAIISQIRDKIDSKTAKIRDIKAEFGFKL